MEHDLVISLVGIRTCSSSSPQPRCARSLCYLIGVYTLKVRNCVIDDVDVDVDASDCLGAHVKKV